MINCSLMYSLKYSTRQLLSLLVETHANVPSSIGRHERTDDRRRHEHHTCLCPAQTSRDVKVDGLHVDLSVLSFARLWTMKWAHSAGQCRHLEGESKENDERLSLAQYLWW